MTATIVHRLIPASVDVTWSFLTESELITEWLGDAARLETNGRFRLELGDGDFLLGQVEESCRPKVLRFRARFMDLPPDLRVDYALQPFAHETFVTVREHGAASAAHAAMRERHWTNLLTKLEARLGTGSCAGAWSLVIEQAVCVALRPEWIALALSDALWWRTTFPGVIATHVDRAADGAVTATLIDPSGADGMTTRAAVGIEACGRDSVVTVRHVGWNNLEDAAQRRQRHRFAHAWARGLQRLAGAHPRPRSGSGT